MQIIDLHIFYFFEQNIYIFLTSKSRRDYSLQNFEYVFDQKVKYGGPVTCAFSRRTETCGKWGHSTIIVTLIVLSS